MRQTWLGSVVEAHSNILVGFPLNYCVNLATLPWLWNPESPKLSAFYVGLVFTVVSMVRQLVIRRWFNGLKFGQKPESMWRDPETEARASFPFPGGEPEKWQYDPVTGMPTIVRE